VGPPEGRAGVYGDPSGFKRAGVPSGAKPGIPALGAIGVFPPTGAGKDTLVGLATGLLVGLAVGLEMGADVGAGTPEPPGVYGTGLVPSEPVEILVVLPDVPVANPVVVGPKIAQVVI
jgi:hypothetical protein